MNWAYERRLFTHQSQKALLWLLVALVVVSGSLHILFLAYQGYIEYRPSGRLQDSENFGQYDVRIYREGFTDGPIDKLLKRLPSRYHHHFLTDPFGATLIVRMNRRIVHLQHSAVGPKIRPLGA